MRGSKWMREATYLTDADRAKIARTVEFAIAAGHESVGVRPASYCGEPAPIAVVTHGPGGCSIYQAVYRAEPSTADLVRSGVVSGTCADEGATSCGCYADLED